jgi:hypothetical protein
MSAGSVTVIYPGLLVAGGTYNKDKVALYVLINRKGE